jgi:glycosyltransferase involved in cell wall biosynthesis
MKLFIQIPCLDEEQNLARVIADLPRKIEGIDEIYTLVIDDGSTDATVETAQRLGVDYILRNPRNLGLARSFTRGLEACLFLDADVIVNTDGDNQYRGADIARLVAPIRDGRADLVVGCRDIANHAEFSPLKKLLQRLGSSVVRRISGTDIPDTTSGFRAIHRTAAMRLSVMGSFSYTLEVLIQAGRTGLRVEAPRIEVNPKTRESRLFRSMPHFVARQIKVILGTYLFYCPMRFFGWLAAGAFAVSAVSILRLSYYLWFVEEGSQKFKGGTGTLLIVSLLVGILCLVSGLIGVVLSGLRFLIEDLRFRMRNISLHEKIYPCHLNLIRAPRFFEWKHRAGTVDRSQPVPTYQAVTNERSQ